jgi:hypothetical protein
MSNQDNQDNKNTTLRNLFKQLLKDNDFKDKLIKSNEIYLVDRLNNDGKNDLKKEEDCCTISLFVNPTMYDLLKDPNNKLVPFEVLRNEYNNNLMHIRRYSCIIYENLLINYDNIFDSMNNDSEITEETKDIVHKTITKAVIVADIYFPRYGTSLNDTIENNPEDKGYTRSLLTKKYIERCKKLLLLIMIKCEKCNPLLESLTITDCNE